MSGSDPFFIGSRVGDLDCSFRLHGTQEQADAGFDALREVLRALGELNQALRRIRKTGFVVTIRQLTEADIP